MRTDDADAVVDLMDAEWGVVERSVSRLRVTHLVETDPGGAWVHEDADGAVAGAALAIVREGVWGLSLLMVAKERRSAGVGRELMGAATAYGADARGGIILSSEDPRALRSYWRAGYALRPSFDAKGIVTKPPPADPAVRPGTLPADRVLVDAASRHVRGAAHGSDLDTMIAQGCELLVHEGGGFAMRADGRVYLLAATDVRIATALLQTAFADVEEAEVDFLDAGQDWAIDVALEAGLRLEGYGGVCVRGDVGPLRPYIPSGAYL